MIRINKWSETFENADTRKRQRLGWFLCPSGTDSKGFRVLMRDKELGVQAFGVFIGLCQAMATFPKEVRARGEFVNSDGSGMELADLWEVTRMELAGNRQILELLEKAGWISLINQQSATSVPPSCQSPATFMPKNSGFVKGEGEGEGKGEGKVEGEESSPPLPEEAFRFCQSAMIPATMEIVEAWRSDRASMGWEKPKGQTMVPIVNWREDLRGFVRAWKNNENKDNGRRNNSPRGNQDCPRIADYSDTEGLKLA